MVTRVPIDPETAVWARERALLSREKAADLLKVPPDRLALIEAGAEEPTASIFRKMADVYLLPEATLLGNVPTADRALPKDFRSFEGAAVSLSYETVVAVRRVQARQDALQALSELDDQVLAPEIPIRSLRDNPEQLGATFRKQMGFPIVEQLALAPSKALYRWRLMIEDMGVAVYVEPLGDDTARGVSLYDNDFPAIIVDQNEKAPGARLFTLFHEFAHLLVRQTGISNFSPRNEVERFCNRFAAAFLMPREAIAAVFTLPERGLIDPDIAQLEFAAQKLCTTISQVALRLEHLGMVADGYFNRIVKTLAKPTPVRRRKGGPEFRYTYTSQYGHHLPGTVISSFERRAINAVEAARMLDTSPANIDAVKKTLKERRDEFGGAEG